MNSTFCKLTETAISLQSVGTIVKSITGSAGLIASIICLCSLAFHKQINVVSGCTVVFMIGSMLTSVSWLYAAAGHAEYSFLNHQLDTSEVTAYIISQWSKPWLIIGTTLLSLSTSAFIIEFNLLVEKSRKLAKSNDKGVSRLLMGANVC